jgi:signal transduction histidine kinase
MLREFCHSLIPLAACRDPEALRRSNRLIGLALAMLIWAPVFTGVYVLLRAPTSAAVLVVTGALTVGLLALLKRTNRPDLCGQLMVALAWSTYSILALLNGGFDAPALAWYTTVPVLAITLAGPRAGLWWSLLCGATILAFYAWPTPRHFNELTPLAAHILEGLSLLGLLTCLHVLTLVYRRMELWSRQSVDRALEAARVADRSKSEFLANMSHEIRTPMTSILGYAELLQQGELEGPMANEALLTIRRNGEHLLTIINDILDVSKIEAGKLVIELRPCSPRQVLEEVVQLMQGRADTKDLPLTLSLEDSLPESILTDATRFRQILINLLGNAIKFTEDGSVGVTAWGDRQGELASCLYVSVRDTGIGMNAAQATRVFEPFQQADSSTTRRFGGTGLGLAISRRLAEMLGGGIEVTSQQDIGTTFTLTIAAPLAIEVEAGELVAAR